MNKRIYNKEIKYDRTLKQQKEKEPKMVKFRGITDLPSNPVVPTSKENDEQIKSNLTTSIYCKIRLVANMVQDELRNKSTGIIHNELIM